MSMMSFSRGPRGPGEVRREIMARRSHGSVGDALYGVLQGKETSETAAAMHTALSEAGYETTRESVEAALEELAVALRGPATTPEPPEPPEPAEEPEAPGPDPETTEELGADVVDLDSRRPDTPDPLEEETPDTPEPFESPGSDPSEVLYYLVDHDVRLEVRDGTLMAGRPAGLTPRLREILSAHKEALITLLDEEAVVVALSEATRHVSESLRRRGEVYGSGDSERAKRYLQMAQNAYERREHALSRYRLRRARMSSEGRQEDDAPPAPRPASSATTPEQRAKASAPSQVPEPPARVEAVKGNDLEPGRDHQVFLNGKATALLLPSLYPSEIALERSKQAYQRANPSMRVEVRRSLRGK